MIRYATAILLSGVVLAGVAQVANTQTPKLAIGDAAPKFTDLPGVDGKKHSLADYKDKDVLVIAITCNHCPVAVAYEDRLVEFTKKHAGPSSKVQFIAINVNTSDADKLESMVKRSKDRGFNFPYLYDESQSVARALNAKVTPEFYVFDKSRKLVYWGSMDDKMNSPTVKYLEPAVEAVLAGKTPATTMNKAFGCGVQYNKK